jgi:hypothetical protein
MAHWHVRHDCDAGEARLPLTVAEHIRSELGEVERKLDKRTESVIKFIGRGFDIERLDLAEVARLVRQRDVLLHLLSVAEGK